MVAYTRPPDNDFAYLDVLNARCNFLRQINPWNVDTQSARLVAIPDVILAVPFCHDLIPAGFVLVFLRGAGHRNVIRYIYCTCLLLVAHKWFCT